MIYNSICFNCKNFKNKSYNGKTYKCKAFPNGIPEEILTGKESHDTVIKGQTGEYVFEEVKS